MNGPSRACNPGHFYSKITLMAFNWSCKFCIHANVHVHAHIHIPHTCSPHAEPTNIAYTHTPLSDSHITPPSLALPHCAQSSAHNTVCAPASYTHRVVPIHQNHETCKLYGSIFLCLVLLVTHTGPVVHCHTLSGSALTSWELPPPQQYLHTPPSG